MSRATDQDKPVCAAKRNLPPLPELVGTLAMLPKHHKMVIESYGEACAATAYQAGKDAGLDAAHDVLDDVGAKLQLAHDYDDHGYWNGVGAMANASEAAILALKSANKDGP